MLRLGASILHRTSSIPTCVTGIGAATPVLSLLARNYATQLLLPALSPTMTDGVIAKWLVEEGQAFSSGDVLYEMETDKATMEVEASEDGVMAKILLPVGSGAQPINTPVAVVCEVGEDITKVVIPETKAAAAPPAATSPAPEAKAPKAPTTPATTGQATTKPLLPSVKFLLQKEKLDSTVIPATGPRGHLLKGDVLSFLASGSKGLPKVTSAPAAAAAAPKAAAPQAPAATAVGENPYTDVALNNMRKIIAKRLTESKQTVPHSYAGVEVCLDEIQKLRGIFKNAGTKISVNDFIVRASARALKDVPEVNSQWINGAIKRNETIDVSVAVATPSGLITPIVPKADTLAVAEISSMIKELAGRAKINKLLPQEYQGGSITISNLGMFGITEFCAIISPPQAAIMAVGAGREVPVPVEVEGQDDSFKIATYMTAKMSFDERVVDFETMNRFLEAFKKYMEKPINMI